LSGWRIIGVIGCEESVCHFVVIVIVIVVVVVVVVVKMPMNTGVCRVLLTVIAAVSIAFNLGTSTVPPTLLTKNVLLIFCFVLH
jgi:hypothetical protein